MRLVLERRQERSVFIALLSPDRDLPSGAKVR